MTQPTYGPKLLRRSRTDRYIGGVCGGLAAYLNMDATLVRILTVVITLFTGAPVVLYVVALFLMPEEEVVPATPTGQGDPVWGAGGPPWAPTGGTSPSAPPASTSTGSFGTTATSTPAPGPAPSDPPRREDGTV